MNRQTSSEAVLVPDSLLTHERPVGTKLKMSFFSTSVSFSSVRLLTSRRAFFHTAVGVTKPTAAAAHGYAVQATVGVRAAPSSNSTCKSAVRGSERPSWPTQALARPSEPGEVGSVDNEPEEDAAPSKDESLATQMHCSPSTTCRIHLPRESIARDAIALSRSSLGGE